MKTIILFFAFVLGLNSVEAQELTLNISNIKLLKGELVIGIFDKEETFLKDGYAYNTYRVKVDESTATITIKDLPKGDYAVSLYHDENMDGICNRNMLGIPKEGYGFSNNIRPKFSAPSFEDCKVSFQKDMVLDIILRK